MAEHAHTTPTLARRRHTRAAPEVLDRRAVTLPVFLHRTEDDGFPTMFDLEDGFATLPGHPALPTHFNWTGVITPALRRRIERDVALLIELLNVLDGDPDLDGGVGDEDCCEAGDDDPASSKPVVRGCGYDWGPGDPADGESTPEDEGEPTEDDLPQRWQPLPPALSSTRCCNGPFQLDSATYAAVRGYAAPPGRPA